MLLTCISAIPIFGQNGPNVGLVCSNIDLNDTPPTSLEGVSVRSTCSTGYSTRFKFYLVQIRSGNTFTFQLTPTNGGDYDFIAWHNPPLPDVHNITLQDINNLPPGDRGNRNTGTQGTTIGLALNAPSTCNGVSGDGLERHYDVVPGDYVLIGIDNWSSNSDYTMTFGGNAELDCYFGKTFYECADEVTQLATFNLDSYIDEVRPPNDVSPYFFYDNEEDALANLESARIPTIQQLPYSEDGKEIFVAFVQENGMVNVVKFVLRTLKTLHLTSDTIYGCYAGTNPMTGAVLGTFNLYDAIPSEYLTDSLIKYNIYYSESGAQNETASNMVPMNEWDEYYGLEGTFYVRLEYDLGTEKKCAKILPLNLRIVRVELAETLKELPVCYGQIVDLTSFQTYFIPTENEYTYAYYNGTNEIANPTAYEITRSSTITVKIGNGSCLQDATIQLNLQDTPIVEFGEMIPVCDTDFDGLFDLNLDDLRLYLTNNVGEYTYSFYLTEEDAQNQTNPVNGSTVGLNLDQEIWVRANNDGICFYITTVPLLYGDQITFTAPTTTLAACADENGNGTFDLTTAVASMGLDTAVTVKYFPTREDAVANTNEITNPTAWVSSNASGNIYILLAQDERCSAITTVAYEVEPLPVFEVEPNVVFCEGEFYTLDLAQYADYTFTVSGSVEEIATKVYKITEAGEYTITATSASGCSTTITLNAVVTELPVFTPFDAIVLCDENFDGRYEINLEEVKQIAQANVGNNFTIKAYATEADAIAETNELTGTTYTVSTLPTKVWVRANSEGTCFAISSIDFVSGQQVEFTATNQTLDTCETPNGSSIVFDFTSMQPLFNVATGVTIKYFTSQADAYGNTNAIANPNAWSTTTSAGTIYVRFEQEGFCSAVTSFNYLAGALPSISIQEAVQVCEGETYRLDLSSYVNYNFTITGGAYTETSPKVYEFTTSGNYVITATTAAGCTNTFTFNVTVNPLPRFTAMTSYQVCDANVDGVYELDLVALSGVVLENNTGITLAYYATEADLLAGVNPIRSDIYLTRLPAKIWVKATTGQNCFTYKGIDLVAANTIELAPATTPLQACMAPNGTTEFDLTSMVTQMNIPANYVVSYYLTLADLQNGRNEITNPTVWSTRTTNGTIYMKLEAAGLCPGYTSFEYQANPLPAIDIEDIYYICDDANFELDLSAYDYNIRVIGANVMALGNNKFRITQVGNYTVEVANEFGCITEYAFEVSHFNEPVISELVIGFNTITVKLVRDASYPNIQYSLDGVNFQTSNILTIPVRGDNYDIYVKIGDCIYHLYNVATIEIPTFFSPNNDGYNDVWKVRPITFNQELDLKIFDRFGKILYEQKGNQDIMWDGIYNGKKLPTTDYWYTIDIQGEGVVRAIKYTGSITLKNK